MRRAALWQCQQQLLLPEAAAVLAAVRQLLLPAAAAAGVQQPSRTCQAGGARGAHTAQGRRRQQQQHGDSSSSAAAHRQLRSIAAAARPRQQHSGQQAARASSSSCTVGEQSYRLDYAHTLWPGTAHTLWPGTAAGAAAAAATADTSSSSTVPADPARAPRGSVVAVAVSGGVDSAVAALLLQQQGYRVFGVFMNNWDAADEAGAGAATCSSAADLADARALCDALGMPLYEADFVARYWNDVFDGFLHGLSQGLTPNPDLACNSHIKFGALLRFARDRGADLLATGHYARLAWAPVQDAAAAGAASAGAAGAAADTTADADAAAPDAAAGWQPLLLTGSDPAKDQSYFLAAVSQQQLRHVMFPVGHLTKAATRQLAAQAGLPQAARRSSAGICFIGRRSFGAFLEAYLPPRPGVYVDAASGQVLGRCANTLAVTIGQKAAGLGGQASRVYVVGKNLTAGVVHVVAGHDHPALFSSSVLLTSPSWVAGRPPAALPRGVAGQQQAGTLQLQCNYQARYRQAAEPCSVQALQPGAAPFVSSRFCQASAAAAAAVGGDGSDLLVATLPQPLRGVAPGQMFVMYDGPVCLGSAVIAAHGPTLHEQPQQQDERAAAG